MRSCWLAPLTLLWSPMLLAAQDVATGPAKGEKVPALKVQDVTGPHQGKEVDYVAERKDKPTVYLLLRADQFDRPMNRFMRELDKFVKKEGGDAYVVAVWLTNDADKTKELLPRIQQSVGYEATALTYFADKAGPKGWGINGDARLTAVITAGGKVAATFGYNSLNETDVPAVRDALKKATGKD
jgi:hypothetical protein